MVLILIAFGQGLHKGVRPMRWTKEVRDLSRYGRVGRVLGYSSMDSTNLSYRRSMNPPNPPFTRLTPSRCGPDRAPPRGFVRGTPGEPAQIPKAAGSGRRADGRSKATSSVRPRAGVRFDSLLDALSR
jgi:hypothetical protein